MKDLLGCQFVYLASLILIRRITWLHWIETAIHKGRVSSHGQKLSFTFSTRCLTPLEREKLFFADFAIAGSANMVTFFWNIVKHLLNKL